METKLRMGRKKANITQDIVAKQANISTLTYQRYESGKRNPDVYTAQLISIALNSEINQLFPLADYQNQINTKEKDHG